jgi:hypothetical protein
MAKSQEQPGGTIELTNFEGALTRKKNGQINSGLAKFSTSFGYDPFSKPGQLTWLESPVDITGSQITDLIVAAKPRYEAASSSLFIYAIGSSGRLYKITPNSISNPNLDTASVLGTLPNASFNFGGSMDFYGSTEKIYIGQDDRVQSVNFDGSSPTTVGTVADYSANRYRPMMQFIGKLIFGNGNNIGAIDSTGTVVSSIVGSHYEHLSPGLPPETYVTDLDVSPDGNYLFITTSGITNEGIATVSNDRQAAAASNGNIYKWNGSDLGITAQTIIPSYAVTALQTFLDNNVFFSNDSFGTSLSSGSQKKITLPNNKSPFANSTLVNGNFVSWIAPELNTAGTGLNASMYYYGNLDDENPKGMWRVMRYSTALANGFVYQTPVNLMTNNKYSTVNNAVNAVSTLGYGKHYFSTFEVNSSNTTVSSTTAKFYRFCITPTGSGAPQLGVWESQNQLFGKRISVSEIRVYTEPTAASNGFQLDIIGSDGNVVTNGTFTYTYAAGTDITLLQGALERINFNVDIKNLYSMGIRVTNTGTTNMIINKIEVDWVYSGK